MVINLLMMKISKQTVNFAKVFIFLNLCLTIYALLFQNSVWLLNIQVAFFSSLFVTLASFLSYKKIYKIDYLLMMKNKKTQLKIEIKLMK